MRFVEKVKAVDEVLVSRKLVIESNVHIKMIDPKDGDVKEERKGHNIFLNYGRDWLAQLISLQSHSPNTPFRSDRIRYVAFGIGGTSQLIDESTIAATYPGYAQDWGGTAAATPPVQTDTDPSVIALEWPVLFSSSSYYGDVAAPATFPDTGIVRFTAVVGQNNISFGSYTSVPISEIGLFTEEVASVLGTPPIDYGSYPATKYMVAYNTFDTLSKTNSFVLQVDWEIRFS